MNTIDPYFFHGVVTSADPGTYVIEVAPQGDDSYAPLLQGVSLASVFALSLGFKENQLPPIGAKVLCLGISPMTCYILGVIPPGDIFTKWPSRTSLKTAGDGIGEKQNSVGYDRASKLHTLNNGRPTDVVGGEVGWSNDFGVMLGAFQQMALLKGSELAQVQTMLLDDLVRIISHNFEHYTCMGESRIWHDGKALMAEFGATHLSAEAMGIPQSTQDKPETVFTKSDKGSAKDDTDFYEMSDENLKTKGIERLKLYFGRLADFIQLYVVRPQEGIRRDFSGGSDELDTGLMRMHVGLDGSVHFSTVSEFFIEKVNWIRVPERVRLPDDPSGDDAEELEYDEKEIYEFDNNFKHRGNPYLYFLQLRNYSAYLNKYTYQNFDKHEKDFKVNKSVNEEKTKLSDIEQVDKCTPTNFAKFKLRTSGMYLLPNGGCMMKNAWGSAFVMDGPDICIQPARDLILQPMRHLIAKVGSHVSVAAAQDITLSSTFGGLSIKTNDSIYAYSEFGGVVLHSDVVAESDPAPKDKALDKVSGIVLKSETGIYNFSKNKVDKITKDYLLIADNLKTQLEGAFNIHAVKGSSLISSGQLDIVSTASTLALLAGASASIAGNSGTILGKKDQQLTVVPKGMFSGPIEGAYPDLQDRLEGIIDSAPKDLLKDSPIFKTQEIIDGLTFYFLDSSEYSLTSNDCIPQTIAQQEFKKTNEEQLQKWLSNSQDNINDTLPYPGKDMWDTFFVTGELKNLEKKDGDVYSVGVSDLKKTVELVRTSMDNYTILL